MKRRKSEEYYYQAISNERRKVISFDIFDTLLLRPFFFPTDLFCFLDREMSTFLNVPDVIDFSTYRKEAEVRIREEKEAIGNEDVTLEEIYQYITDHYPFPKELVNRLMKSEIELEKKYCYIREFGKKLFQLAIDQGKRVILVSDMYLPSELIVQILKEKGITGFEKIYVSAETKRTKVSGNMYSYICKDLGLCANAFLHIGDNLFSDVKVPRKMGWNVLPLYNTRDLFNNKIPGVRTGNSYRHSFRNFRSSLPSNNPLDYFGLRCLLAVAINRAFDNPFSTNIKKGDYAGCKKLFGNLALGLYCLSQGLWVAQIALEETPGNILFFHGTDGCLIKYTTILVNIFNFQKRHMFIYLEKQSILY